MNLSLPSSHSLLAHACGVLDLTCTQFVGLCSTPSSALCTVEQRQMHTLGMCGSARSASLRSSITVLPPLSRAWRCSLVPSSCPRQSVSLHFASPRKLGNAALLLSALPSFLGAACICRHYRSMTSCTPSGFKRLIDSAESRSQIRLASDAPPVSASHGVDRTRINIGRSRAQHRPTSPNFGRARADVGQNRAKFG